MALRQAMKLIVMTRQPTLSEQQREELRQLVYAAAEEFKANGASPEHMVIRLRQLAVDAGFRPSYHTLGGRRETRRDDHLLTDIVKWSLEHYNAGHSFT